MGDFDNKMEDLGGRAKEATGAATDNDSLRNEGRADQASAGLKDKLEDAKDGVENLIDKARGKDHV